MVGGEVSSCKVFDVLSHASKRNVKEVKQNKKRALHHPLASSRLWQRTGLFLSRPPLDLTVLCYWRKTTTARPFREPLWHLITSSFFTYAAIVGSALSVQWLGLQSPVLCLFPFPILDLLEMESHQLWMSQAMYGWAG